jgi:outer membrane protein assembly factor BamB
MITVLLATTAAAASPQWPQFRGPSGNGHVDDAALPLTWSETEHVRWKTPLHDRGHSSPVLWDNQLWLTTATKDGKRLFAVCVDRTTGKILHDRKVFDVEKPEPIHAMNSYASPTPAIEAGRLYVHFGTYGTACLDTSTAEVLWTRRDLHCNHFRGPGSSPFLFRNLLILHFDGFDVQYVVALDKTTGKTVWKTKRSTDFGQLDGDLRKACSTPIAIEAAGRWQLISSGAQAALAYDPMTGKELWKVRYPGGYSNVSRPLWAHGLVLLNTGFDKPELWAVRPDGRGDVTDSHVVWKLKKSVPCKPSPVLVKDLIFMVNDGGIASCVEAGSGKVVWHERIGGEFSASPIDNGQCVYFFDQEGKTTVIAASRQYTVLAVNRLDDGLMASPAAAAGALFLRTATHLYRIDPSP